MLLDLAIRQGPGTHKFGTADFKIPQIIGVIDHSSGIGVTVNDAIVDLQNRFPHGDLEKARARVANVNRERADYLNKLYGVRIDDCSDYDLVVNSDRFSVPKMVELILEGMRQAGYDIPADMLQAV